MLARASHRRTCRISSTAFTAQKGYGRRKASAWASTLRVCWWKRTADRSGRRVRKEKEVRLSSLCLLQMQEKARNPACKVCGYPGGGERCLSLFLTIHAIALR